MAKLYLKVREETKETELKEGLTILDYAHELDIPLTSRCGGGGTCGECRIVVEKGATSLNEISGLEKRLKNNERLACQTKVIRTDKDIYAKILHYGNMQILSTGIVNNFQLNPLTKNINDEVIFDGKKIGEYKNGIYGIAADIGTTTVVLHLMNLENGELMSTHAFENPQRKIDGDNVISRITYDKTHPQKLQKRLIMEINEQIKKMKCDPSEIYEMVVVGNTTMRDLFFLLDVQSVGVVPYKSIMEINGNETFINKPARELKIAINPLANIYGAPLIGSHVGADTVAVCLNAGLFDRTNETAIAIDIGTNGQIVLKKGKDMVATSCAAGGALEKTPGIAGAIERFSITDGKINYKTIENSEPIGLCGSGIVDFLSETLRTGLMDEMGNFNDGPRFQITDQLFVENEYTRGGFLLGKAALSLSIKTLLDQLHMKADDIEKLYLAGSYGNYIDPIKAMNIGLIPSIGLDKVIKIGNAAASGAKEMLLSENRRNLAQVGAREITHVSLELLSDYGSRLVGELSYKKIDSH